MAKNCTDDEGNFWLGGWATDFGFDKIDPTLVIYHKCNPATFQVGA